MDVCRANKIEAILPIGGGSCYDSAKAIAVGATFPADVPASDVWKLFEGTK